MKTIYFIRHGQTKWNVANKICGATDIELSAGIDENVVVQGCLVPHTTLSGEIDESVVMAEGAFTTLSAKTGKSVVMQRVPLPHYRQKSKKVW